jgi:hypothetical protein
MRGFVQMKAKPGCLPPSQRAVSVSATALPHVLERVDKVALSFGITRSAVINKLITLGLPGLEKEASRKR